MTKEVRNINYAITRFILIFRYEQELRLPQLPEMVFAENCLKIYHQSGCGIDFNALDALRLVDASTDLIKVAASEEWQNAR